MAQNAHENLREKGGSGNLKRSPIASYAITQHASSVLPSTFFSLVEAFEGTSATLSGCGRGRLGFNILPDTFGWIFGLDTSS